MARSRRAADRLSALKRAPTAAVAARRFHPAVRRDGGSVRRGTRAGPAGAGPLQDLRQPAARGQPGADDLDEQRDRPGRSRAFAADELHPQDGLSEPEGAGADRRARRRSRRHGRGGSRARRPAAGERGHGGRRPRRAARAALAGGGAEDAAAVGRSLAARPEGRPQRRRRGPDEGVTDLGLYEADRPWPAGGPDRGARARRRTSRCSLPGRRARARPRSPLWRRSAHRPLAVKRASDLFSHWVGETEARIADAFAEARERGAVLLFDEAHLLLSDRAEAERSWEVSQVNELLTWMHNHPLPFVAATNFPRRLDPAALRRFVFKLELGPLSPATGGAGLGAASSGARRRRAWRGSRG